MGLGPVTPHRLVQERLQRLLDQLANAVALASSQAVAGEIDGSAQRKAAVAAAFGKRKCALETRAGARAVGGLVILCKPAFDAPALGLIPALAALTPACARRAAATASRRWWRWRS
jgi:hypothetical protein